MPTTVRSGAAAPEDLRFVLDAVDTGLDLSTATAAVFHVRLPSGDVVDWTASILAGATAMACTVQHVFAPEETVQLGVYEFYVTLTVPGGTWRSEPACLTVKSPFAGTC